MKTYSIADINNFTGYSHSYLLKLAKDGKLTGAVQTSENKHWKVASTRDQIKEDIAKCTSKKPYQKKNGKVVTTPVVTHNNSGLSMLLEIAAIPSEKRALIKQLSEKFSEAELRLLLEL